MFDKLKMINNSISEIRDVLGAECSNISDLPDMVRNLVNDSSRNGYTTAFVFSSFVNPSVPTADVLNTDTGLVENLSEEWSQTGFRQPSSYTLGRNLASDAELNWMSFAIFSPFGERITEWSNPVNLKGIQGIEGKPGADGLQGPKGDAGEKGDDAISYRVLMVYTSAEEEEVPKKPVGGKWVLDSDELIKPSSTDGFVWEFNIDLLTKRPHIWTSTAVFNEYGEIIEDWCEPFRMTGWSKGLDYLKQVYSNFDTEINKGSIETGVVLSGTMAVVENMNNKDIVAGIHNGSDILQGSMGVGLMIFAGAQGVKSITDTSANTTYTKTNNATTEIYNDGTIVVDSPNASGKIVIGNDGLQYFDGDNPIINFGSSCTTGPTMMIGARGTTLNNQACYNAALYVEGGDDYKAITADGEVLINSDLMVYGDTSLSNVEAADITAASIKVDEGDVEINGGDLHVGGNVTCRTITPILINHATTLSSSPSTLYDSWLMPVTSDKTITLPSTSKNGLTIRFLKCAETTVTIVHGSAPILSVYSKTETATGDNLILDSNVCGELIFQYYNGTWYFSAGIG